MQKICTPLNPPGYPQAVHSYCISLLSSKRSELISPHHVSSRHLIPARACYVSHSILEASPLITTTTTYNISLYHLPTLQVHVTRMTSSQYTSEYPPLDLDPDFKSFFQAFYKVSDTPSAHEAYVDFFTKDAIVIMASKRVEGSERSSAFLIPVPTPLPPVSLTAIPDISLLYSVYRCLRLIQKFSPSANTCGQR
jgi:hypothetical protein